MKLFLVDHIPIEKFLIFLNFLQPESVLIPPPWCKTNNLCLIEVNAILSHTAGNIQFTLSLTVVSFDINATSRVATYIFVK